MSRLSRFFRQAGFAAAAITMSALGPAAEAASISSLIVNGFNTASDEDREYLIDRVNTGTKGQIDVGDSLRGSFNINTLNSGSANVGGITPNNEWTGIFQLLVTSKTPIGPFTLFTFGPDPAFAGPAGTLCGGVASCIATQPAVNAILPGTGAMIVMFEHAANNFAGDFTDAAAGALAALNDDGTPHLAPHPGICSAANFAAGFCSPIHTNSDADVSSAAYVTEEAFLARAADGTRFWTIGFTNGVPNGPGSATAGASEGFNALTTLPGADNILAAFTVTAATGFVVNNAGLNRIANGIAETGDGIPLGVVPTIFGGTGANFAFTGETRGNADRDTSFEATSDITASFFVAPVKVSNPGTFVLLGGGVLLLANATALRRHRRHGK